MGQLSNFLADLCEQDTDVARLKMLALGCDSKLRSVPEPLSIAAAYASVGISVVPQLPEAKRPCVSWKDYQKRRPTAVELIEWFTKWPEAGIAFVLGPVSDLLVVDVDGEEAHRALLKLLGRIPKTPTVRSGSGKPNRYHLLFAHPDQKTNAKATPVHPKLEFKGGGAIVVAPPSRHKSGNNYKWVAGRSIFEIDRIPPPKPILDALAKHFTKGRSTRGRRTGQHRQQPVKTRLERRSLLELSDFSLKFLGGDYAHKSNWNNNLFRSACEMKARGFDEAAAMPLLLKGASPWTDEDEASAIATIRSAFSQSRELNN